MTKLPKLSSPRRAWLFAVLPVVALAGSLTPAAAGSEDPSFQRHFWRGQHGHGNIDHYGTSTARADTGFASAEALVEEGTRGDAIARRARRR